MLRVSAARLFVTAPYWWYKQSVRAFSLRDGQNLPLALRLYRGSLAYLGRIAGYRPRSARYWRKYKKRLRVLQGYQSRFHAAPAIRNHDAHGRHHDALQMCARYQPQSLLVHRIGPS